MHGPAPFVIPSGFGLWISSFSDLFPERARYLSSSMRIPILMPQLGEAIAEATILRLEVAPGDSVQAEQEIMEVETQKATMSVTAPCSGQVVEFSCRVGESYPVGTTLGFLTVTREEAARAGVEPVQDAPVTKAAPAEEAPDNLHFKLDSSIEMHQAEAPQVIPTLTGLPVPVNATGASYISPRLRVRMHELGINAADLSAVAGSGGGGRVTVEDFEAFMEQLEQHKMTPASPMRIAVADSMRRSWTRPLATIGIRVNMDPLLAHRKQQREPKAGPALYAMRALAIALSENTAAAGRLVGKRVVHPPAIDLGFAVEVEEGVLVPVIRAVDQKPLASLVERYNDLVKRSRERKLPPDARGPGIATITNFGTFGIEWATPIPLPEQSLLLGLGAGIKQPVWDPGSHSFQPMTQSGLTLSFDHRVIDGGGAGRLLHRVASLMQTPEVL
jgi:pyruvate/2-oxoglutarate dehydrogenase complex dihydrolipoamide acyltransferase (E2) component